MKNKKPLYQQIVDSIMEEIDSEKLNPGDKVPSEWEIVERFKVNRSTVRRAYDKLVEQKVLSRVPGLGTFLSQEPKARELKDISMIYSTEYTSPESSFYFKSFQGVENEAKKLGIRVYIITLSRNDSDETILKNISQAGESGGVILSGLFKRGALKEVINLNVPKVFLGLCPPSESLDIVAPDNVLGAFNAVNVLISLGHRRIAYAVHNINKDPRFQERMNGYRNALSSNGIEFEKNLILDHPGADSPEEYLSGKLPDAIFAANDAIASEVIRASNKLGIRVPEQLSVLGFDDREFAKHLSPALSTVSIPREEMGEVAFRTLLNRIENPDSIRLKTLVPTKLLLRESVRR